MSEQEEVPLDPQMARSRLERGAQIIRSYIKHLTTGPGVYRMIDKNNQVLYVGKAIALRKRVASYTRPARLPLRLQRMISATNSMEFLLTANEVEALLLENNLIKRFRPPYNVLLRDDKTYVEILIRQDHDYPQIMRHRGSHKVKGKYFGPYASSAAVSETLNLIERIFMLRNCSDTIFKGRTRPCLQYQIKRCSAPCCGKISASDYQRTVQEAITFLNGQDQKLGDGLRTQMDEAANNREYERAASLRDRIRALTQLQASQDINNAISGDADILAISTAGGQAAVQSIFYRGGRHNGNRVHFPTRGSSGRGSSEDEENSSALMAAVIGQLYHDLVPPPLLILSHLPDQADLLQDALSRLAGRRVKLEVPKRGARHRLIRHAITNAADALGRRLNERASQAQLLQKLREFTGISTPVNRIEIYDNSHLGGVNPIGAMVVAGPQGFEKPHYRTFNIKQDLSPEPDHPVAQIQKNTETADDYAMMREVMIRRFRRALKEQANSDLSDEDSLNPAEADMSPSQVWPDLVILDGGLGQIHAAIEALTPLDFSPEHPFPFLMAVAKGPERNAGREKIFLFDPSSQTKDVRGPISLPENDALLYFIQRLRDEAHRFAIGTQRKRRHKSTFHSPLDEVAGIGAKRKRQLLLHFGSARAVAGAGLEDLKQMEGISQAMAQRIYDHFHPS